MEALFSLLLAALLGAASIHVSPQNVDCRSCHAPDATSGARDLSYIYAKPALHHAVGVKYPVDATDGFNRPSGRGADITFFDRNDNGQPDGDEIRLFGTGNAAMLECATCHQEHGNPAAPVNVIRKNYLRMDNVGSALCTTCHNK